MGQGLLIQEVSRTHTKRLTTVGRTPLDESSARRRDLYLTTHNTHNRQISMPLAGFEPTIPAGELPQTHTLDRLATGIGRDTVYKAQIKIHGVTSQNAVVLNKEFGVQTFTPHVATEYRNLSRQFKKAVYIRTYHQHAKCLY